MGSLYRRVLTFIGTCPRDCGAFTYTLCTTHGFGERTRTLCLLRGFGLRIVIGFDLEVTLRAALWQTGGLYLDWGYHSVDEGPEIFVDYSFGQSESQPLFEGGGFHFDAGLSFFF